MHGCIKRIGYRVRYGIPLIAMKVIQATSCCKEMFFSFIRAGSALSVVVTYLHTCTLCSLTVITARAAVFLSAAFYLFNKHLQGRNVSKFRIIVYNYFNSRWFR